MLSFVDATESRTVSTMALSGGRMTWIVAVPWAAADLGRLANKRYITVAGGADDAKSGHQAKLDRCCTLGCMQSASPSSVCAPAAWHAGALEMLLLPTG